MENRIWYLHGWFSFKMVVSICGFCIQNSFFDYLSILIVRDLISLTHRMLSKRLVIWDWVLDVVVRENGFELACWVWKGVLNSKIILTEINGLNSGKSNWMYGDWIDPSMLALWFREVSEFVIVSSLCRKVNLLNNHKLQPSRLNMIRWSYHEDWDHVRAGISLSLDHIFNVMTWENGGIWRSSPQYYLFWLFMIIFDFETGRNLEIFCGIISVRIVSKSLFNWDTIVWNGVGKGFIYRLCQKCVRVSESLSSMTRRSDEDAALSKLENFS